MSAMISTGSLKYLVYDRNPPESYTLGDLKFDRATFDATTRLHALYEATDPDLSAFGSAVGKLILWYGLADPHICPLNTIAYYTAIKELMGKPAVDKFAVVSLPRRLPLRWWRRAVQRGPAQRHHGLGRARSCSQ